MPASEQTNHTNRKAKQTSPSESKPPDIRDPDLLDRLNQLEHYELRTGLENQLRQIQAERDNLAKLSPEEHAILTAEIRDEDLLQQLAAFKGTKLTAVTERRLRRTQWERDQREAKRSLMTPIQRRRDIAREKTQDLPSREDIHYIHSVLALCSLPYKKPSPEQREFIREAGKMSLLVEAGRLKNPSTGDLEWQGLPYGPKARLLQLHICTRAVIQNSPEVYLEDNLTSFVRSLGFDITGGKRGSLSAFKEQLQRLAACNLTIYLWDGQQQTRTIKHASPIESFDVWFPDNPDQKMLWPNKVVLSQRFFETLKEHSMPIDIRIFNALTHSARQMDIVYWLAHRLPRVDKSYLIPWELLKEQFSDSPNKVMRNFKLEFKKDLAEIAEAVESKKLPITLTDKGALLYHVDPKDYFVPPKRSKRLK